MKRVINVSPLRGLDVEGLSIATRFAGGYYCFAPSELLVLGLKIKAGGYYCFAPSELLVWG
ncbi:MAG: hypothetical protein A2X12_09735 [Bacteroidetes bacterium GWE2_29_8]|nr:MAG: hypothetical protein A2X12_09735 [Bacteroidetes bacterium GWE2_29_8]OFY16619.1 MAG: hypothetical protein A2X02_05630 [Bacteroidetes bacterium GWF2_29_10]